MRRSLLLLAAIVGLLAAAGQFQLFVMQHNLDSLAANVSNMQAQIGGLR